MIEILKCYSIIIVNRASSESYQGSSIKECTKFRGENSCSKPAGLCYWGGEEGHFAW
jgi:hypothetical protein